MPDELTTDESKKLERYEMTIDAGIKTAAEVGMALIAIRDERLYRREHDSFEAYLDQRWQMHLSRAKQYIVAAQVEEELKPGTANNGSRLPSPKSEFASTKTEFKSEKLDILPKNERVARAVAEAPKGERKEVWEEAVATAPKSKTGTPKVTAAHVKSVVAKRKLPDAIAALDAVGHEITGEKLLSDFSVRPDYRSLAARVSILDSEFKMMLDKPGSQFASRHAQEWTAGVKNLRQILRFCIPHAVCPYCKGKACDKCRKAGWLPEEIWLAVPKELRGNN